MNVKPGELKGFPTRLMGLLGIAIFTPALMNAVSSSGPVSALGALVGLGALMGVIFSSGKLTLSRRAISYSSCSRLDWPSPRLR